MQNENRKDIYENKDIDNISNVLKQLRCEMGEKDVQINNLKVALQYEEEQNELKQIKKSVKDLKDEHIKLKQSFNDLIESINQLVLKE